MVEKESIKMCPEAPWKMTPDLLQQKKISLAMTSNFKDRCIIEFTDLLPSGLRRVFEDLDASACIISGQNPSVIQIFTAEGVSRDVVMKKTVQWLKEAGIDLEEVPQSELE
ncbi:MAG: hypothetical protein WBE27_01145, partial [Microgenomates group bacterium]